MDMFSYFIHNKHTLGICILWFFLVSISQAVQLVEALEITIIFGTVNREKKKKRFFPEIMRRNEENKKKMK